MEYEELPRTKFGIQELDNALNGGIPNGNIVLVSGGAGTGKSTLALQYAINGATVFGEKSLYVSTEQNRAELIRQAAGFNWDIESLEQKSLLKVMFFDITNGTSFLKQLEEVINAFQPKRLVIDSLTTLTDALLVSGIGEGEEFSMVQIAETVNPIPRTDKIVSKSILYSLFRVLKKFKLTTILTSELPEEHEALSADGVSEFVADGVILLHFLGIGGLDSRSARIRKMRYSDHEKDILRYNIGAFGIELSDDDIKI
jgi:circadian clock protein KaiC